MLLTSEQIQYYLKQQGEMITNATAEKLTDFIHQASNHAYMMAPVLYEYPNGIWAEKMQYFEMGNGVQAPIEPLRKGRIMFVEEIPKKVPVLDLVRSLEESSDPKLKEYAMRIREVGIET